jgi:glycosyltransferase involved in cell wall biosynthesis
MRSARLVSVVVPAFNASRTIDETLRSIRSQTHRELEIIVVDDGSTDNTGAIAARHAAVDDRIKVLAQQNQGVAAARNHGWRQARSDVIAFADADDLWAPTKIERQLEVLDAGGDRIGLVYCWSVTIGMDSEILWTSTEREAYEGDVFERMLIGNFIGNGSAALIRRQPLIDVGGFDSGLRAADAEGCEDLLLYAKVAARYHFALVPEDLVGYRRTEGAMSSNGSRMLRSWAMVVDMMLNEHPDQATRLKTGLRYYFEMQVRHAFQAGRFASILPLILIVLRTYPGILVNVTLLRLPLFALKAAHGFVRRLQRPSPAGRTSGPSSLERFAIGGVRQDR